MAHVHIVNKPPNNMRDCMAHPSKKIDITKALKQRVRGMTYQQIADDHGVSKPTAYLALKPILSKLANKDDVEFYRKEQANILDGITARTVAHITNEKMENASFKDLCVGAAVLIDKSRLIQGQSTSNSSIMLRAVLSSFDVVESGTDDNV